MKETRLNKLRQFIYKRQTQGKYKRKVGSPDNKLIKGEYTNQYAHLARNKSNISPNYLGYSKKTCGKG